ncbi:MAG: radical SAM protein, partial [Chloroflexota bacterium]
GTEWEQVDMDDSTVLDYKNLKAEDLERWQKQAWREWAFRPGPALTYLKMLATPGALKSAVEVGVRHLAWAKS